MTSRTVPRASRSAERRSVCNGHQRWARTTCRGPHAPARMIFPRFRGHQRRRRHRGDPLAGELAHSGILYLHPHHRARLVGPTHEHRLGPWGSSPGPCVRRRRRPIPRKRRRSRSSMAPEGAAALGPLPLRSHPAPFWTAPPRCLRPSPPGRPPPHAPPSRPTPATIGPPWCGLSPMGSWACSDPATRAALLTLDNLARGGRRHCAGARRARRGPRSRAGAPSRRVTDRYLGDARRSPRVASRRCRRAGGSFGGAGPRRGRHALGRRRARGGGAGRQRGGVAVPSSSPRSMSRGSTPSRSSAPPSAPSSAAVARRAKLLSKPVSSSAPRPCSMPRPAVARPTAGHRSP